MVGRIVAVAGAAVKKVSEWMKLPACPIQPCLAIDVPFVAVDTPATGSCSTGREPNRSSADFLVQSIVRLEPFPGPLLQPAEQVDRREQHVRELVQLFARQVGFPHARYCGDAFTIRRQVDRMQKRTRVDNIAAGFFLRKCPPSIATPRSFFPSRKRSSILADGHLDIEVVSLRTCN